MVIHHVTQEALALLNICYPERCTNGPPSQRDSHQALSQIPFTVKKQKPPVIREDYWQPLCMIHFKPGQGIVGRNVFQKLRELRQLHELDWGWQTKEFQKLSRKERGERIHNQKPNAVADIAAVLGGHGRGNLMWTTEPKPVEKNAAVDAAKEAEEQVKGKEEDAVSEAEKGVESATATVDPEAVQEPVATTAATAAPEGSSAGADETKTSTSKSAPPEDTGLATMASEEPSEQGTVVATKRKSKTKAARTEPQKRLLNATIYWANDVDLYWARKWSDNVEHQVGLPDGVKVWNWQTRKIQGDKETSEDTKEVQHEVKSDADKVDADLDANDKETAGNEGQGEGEAREPAEKQSEPAQKKGWLGWLGGKSGGSSQDARA